MNSSLRSEERPTLGSSLEASPADIEARLAALASFRQYGPGYNRAVNTHATDVELFAGRSDWAAATHYLLMAECAGGLLTWDEAVARDPFRA